MNTTVRTAGIGLSLLVALAAAIAWAQSDEGSALGGATSASPGRAQPIGQDRPFAKWTWTNADLTSVFQELSTVAGKDIVISDQVGGRLSLTVTNKSWKDILNIICRIKKLSVIDGESYFYVMTEAEFQQDKLNDASNQQMTEQVMPLRREIIRLSNVNATEIRGSIESLLSSRGKITIVQHLNALIIFDTERNIGQIRAMVQKLDIETEQINISAKIIQVSSGSLQNMGIQWGLFGKVNGGPLVSAEHLPGPSANIVQNALERLSYGVMSSDKFSIALAYLFQDNKGEVIAQPSITTLDNKEARIFMGGRLQVLAKDISGNTVVQFVEAGTELVVTPHVSAPNRVMLNIKAKKESAAGDGSIQSQTAATEVVVNNGETVVIAGLTTNEMSKGDDGIPFLKDLPFIGALFKRSRSSHAKKDLLIFVTPHIIQKDVETISNTNAPVPDQSTVGETR